MVVLHSRAMSSGNGAGDGAGNGGRTYLLPEIDPVTRKATGRMKEFRDINGNVTTPLVGRLIRQTAEMSAHERSAQADAMRRQLVELTAAHNRLVALVEARHQSSEALIAKLNDTQSGFNRSLAEHSLAVVQMFYGRTLWQRVRWVLVGR